MLIARTTSAEHIELLDAPRPQPAPHEALLRVHTVTLCGTDLHIWQDDYATELPIVQGHEFSAVIEDLPGSTAVDAEGTPLSVGDTVVVSPMIWCGSCHACRIGRSNACRRMSVLGCYQDGAFAEQIAVAPEKLYRLPDGVDPATSALAEPISISLQAVARGRPVAGERAVVLGCGPIGLFAIRQLKDLGVEVLAVDTLRTRTRLAEQFGADRTLVLDPAEDFPSTEYTELTEDWTDGDGPSLVLEATGMPASLANALQVVATAGRVVCVGISDQQLGLSMRLLPVKEIDLLGSRNSCGLLGEALRFLASHEQLVDSLVTHRFVLRDLDRAMATLADRTQPVGKIAIEMPGAGDRTLTAVLQEQA